MGFTTLVLNFTAPKTKIKSVFKAGYTVAMVTYCAQQ